MQTNTLRIIAAVVDTYNLTLYKEDGDTVTIPQGDARVRSIVDTAVPLLISQGYADISLEILAEENDFVQFEAVSNGAVKLFRIAKDKLLSLMGVTQEGATQEPPVPVPPVMPISIGNIPSKKSSQARAVEEILQHAVSVTSPDFNEKGIATQGNVVEKSGITIKEHSDDTATDTIIAVVGGTVIPGVEKIKS